MVLPAEADRVTSLSSMRPLVSVRSSSKLISLPYGSSPGSQCVTVSMCAVPVDRGGVRDRYPGLSLAAGPDDPSGRSLALPVSSLSDLQSRGDLRPRAIVALGGNALLRRGEPLEAESQARAARTAAGLLARVAATHRLVITHGNGPQVGLLALISDAYAGTAPYPLDVLGSETEGQIGYVLELSSTMQRRRSRSYCCSGAQARIRPHRLARLDVRDACGADPCPVGPAQIRGSAWTTATRSPDRRRSRC